jgi:hypothetical protein
VVVVAVEEFERLHAQNRTKKSERREQRRKAP